MVWWLLHTAVAGLEICDGVDNDGDGQIDEPPHAVFDDVDNDGYGDPESFTVFDTPCQTPTAAPPTDCNDEAPQQRPGVGDNCDGIDDDCDGEVDGGFCLPCLRTTDQGNSYLRCGLLSGQRSWQEAEQECEDRGYHLAVPDSPAEQDMLEGNTGGLDRWIGLQDLDDDGAFLTWDDLVPPSVSWAPGEPLSDGTCALVADQPDDPGLATRACDDAIGWICEADCVPRNWYLDDDGDGQGAGAPVPACTAPTDHVAVPGDCADDDATRHSTATELCNGIDDDCDGDTDETGGASTLWYDDLDGDGAGDPATAVATCSPTPQQVNVGGDCAPDDPTIHPLADEVCNGIDDDCDGDTDTDDDSVVDALLWYEDLDGDGYGTSEVHACSQPPDTAATGGDCQDDDPAISPGAAETCNGTDDDCNGQVDDVTGGTAWYADVDGDGLGDPNDVVFACQPPADRVLDGGDCDDDDPAVGLGQTWYVDVDGDGHAGLTTRVACTQEPDLHVTSDDCDDDDAATSPGAPELCNLADDDCDGSTDEDAVDAPLWYPDTDGDGYGVAPGTAACDAPTATVSDLGDCDDSDPAISPGEPERCNGFDDDCDGLVDDEDDVGEGVLSYLDQDGDGFGDEPIQACEPPPGAVATAGDCDDSAPDRYPGADEIGDDGVDQDCDGADMAYVYGNGADCGCASTSRALPRWWRR